MQIIDWGVVVAYALGMLAVGWYYGRKAKSDEDYMLGGRQMRSWMVGLSLFASLFSAVSYLAMPGEVIKYGPMLRCGVIAYPFVYLITGWLIIPAFMNLKVSSAYELLEIKLGPNIRLLASVLFLVLRLSWMSLIIYICAVKVIVPIMGWAESAALWVSMAMGVVTIIYTSSGGLKAVVFTDVVQSFILFSAAILAMFIIGNNSSSVTSWFSQDWPETWIGWSWLDMDARVSFVPAFASVFCWYVFTAASDQMAIQRYLSTRDVCSARRTLLVTLVFDVLVSILLIILGLALLSFYEINMASVPGGSIAESADQLFPLFIVEALPVGLTGLAIAGLLAAAMSSLSSGVNSCSLAISRDFVDRFARSPIADSTHLKISKVTSLVVGAVIVLLSLGIGNIRGNLISLCFKAANLWVAPLFVPFFFAVFIKGSKEKAVFTATIISSVVAVLISFSGEIFGNEISFLWIMPGAFVAGAVSGLVLNFIFKENRNSR